ncbi:MAG: hypothetical protein AABX65_01235 [Nanoarchaeota archaeon]
MKKCVYCQALISEEQAVDVCGSCGVKVWGEKMFQAIKDNMDGAKRKGDLFQGFIGDSKSEK